MGLRPQNKEELFNLWHASLRDVIERIFGVLKKGFRILLLASEYQLKMQIRIPLALTAIHNFIRIHDLTSLDEEVNIEGDEADEAEFMGALSEPRCDESNEDESVKAWRDSIVEEMWNNYQQVLLKRGEVDAGFNSGESGDGEEHETWSDEEDGDRELEEA
jgi:hypothetical protein